MKNNNMKKIIMVLAIGFLFVVGHSVLATSIWNQSGNDCQGLTIATISGADGSTSNGIVSPCWPNTSITANPGDWVNIRIYYHNSSDQTGTPVTATNTKVSLSGSLGSSNSHTFSGNITSNQGNLNLGSVSVNIADGSSQSLTFISANWTPDQGAGGTSQSGSGIMGSGFTLGSIAPGFAHQGSVVVSLKVSSTAVHSNCTINSFTASPNGINQGDSSNLSWSTSNCNTASITSLGSVNVNDSRNVSPSSTTTYILNASDSSIGSVVTRSVIVTVNNYQPSNCTISNFYASPTTINSGNSSTLYWNTNNCSSVTISNLGYNVPTSSYNGQTIYPQNTTTYTLNAYDNNGNLDSTMQTTVNVINQNTNCGYNSFWNGSYCQVNNYNSCTISNFTASPTVISSGGSSTLNWNTNGCSSVTISNLGYNVPTSGNQVIYPTYTTNYILTAYGNGGGQQSQSVTVSINNYGVCPAGTFWNVNHCATAIIPVAPVVYTNPVHNTVIQNTTVVNANSPIMLKIEDRFQNINRGDNVEYTITYQNLQRATIKGAILQVVIPKGVTFSNTSRGTYSDDTKTVSVPLEDLVKGVTGTVYVEAKADSFSSVSGQIVTNAVIIYTDNGGAQENAMAYVLNDLGSNSSLGAAALFSGIASLGLLGILLLILIILLIVYLVRRNSNKREARLDMREDRLDRRA